MDFISYKHKFILEAQNLGYSATTIDVCLDYAEKLNKSDLPIIYNLTHLSKLTGVKKNYLIQSAVVSKHSFAYYRTFNVKKKRGGFRVINEPLPNLKIIQYWILNNILSRIEISPYAKAYIKGRDLKQNLRFHRNKSKVLNLDIEDFFTNIDFNCVQKIFLDRGYSTTLSKYLAKICCLEEHLPQGAPTSPYLSNIYMLDFDNKVSEYTKSKKINYTRYADDMTFSGDFDEKEIIEFVSTQLNTKGLALNMDKKRLMLNTQRQVVTGVVVNEKIQLSKDQRKSLRQEYYYIKKYGLENHLAKRNIVKNNYVDYLIGKINFGIYLNRYDESLIEFKNYLLNYKRHNQK